MAQFTANKFPSLRVTSMGSVTFQSHYMLSLASFASPCMEVKNISIQFIHLLCLKIFLKIFCPLLAIFIINQEVLFSNVVSHLLRLISVELGDSNLY